ncbi:MAG: hypothetical protein PUB22_07005, partial [Clostridiales bacterium]|nr:hypothetical protein [Clostridiales bacterium]
IDSISVKGQVVTLLISDETQATANNKLIYSGSSPEGVRERNAFGIYNTGAWYRDENGVIHYGKDDNDAYENNTTGMGYQARECLELKLRHADEAEAAAECLADEKGQYNEAGKWAPTVDRQFGEGAFLDLYDLQIPSTAAPATDGTGDAYVQGYYYIPEDYDPANGIVFTLQGNGISYWKIADGCDNKGCGITYDSATTSWANKGAIVVNIHDRSGFGKGEYRDYYDFVVDDVNVMKYFLEKYEVTGNIVLQGNSRGTSASSSVIQALAGCEYKKNGSGELVTLDKEKYDFQIDTFICQNGMLGRNIWTDEDYETIVKTGLKVWVFDGEQDTNNIDTITKYTAAAEKAGYSDEWIAENIRLTAYPSELYAYWGESDHSTTRINGWYFDDAAYYGSDLQIVDGKIVYNTKLEDGDTYTVLARGASRDGGMEKTGYEYKVYDDLYQQWALEANPLDVEVSAITEPGHFGQKLKAVIIKYDEKVDGSKLTQDSFVVRAVKDNLAGTFKTSVIERVYTNDKPELLESGSVAGQYVIIETNDFDKVGLVADTFYYKDAYGAKKSIAVRKDLDNCYFINVIQKDDVVGENGEVVGEAPKAPMYIEQDQIDHDVLDEFNYIFINDEEANDVLKEFTFQNNNNPYSLSSNTTKFDHTALTDKDRLGDLNEATLSGLGVRFWYQLPDDYDPNKTYPLFLFAHGTGESMTTAVTGSGEVLSNHGAHFNIGYPTGVWATTEDYGYEDVIVVTPQYYNGNSPRSDGYERDDAFRVALCYALKNFSVDRDRVYVSGTSQGAGRTTALVRDCAEYITAAIVQNGGYSSKLSNAADLDPVGQHEDIFQYATDNNVAIWFFQGVNDFISKPLTAETMYNAWINNYKEAGRSDAWLENHTRFTYLNNKIYLDMNETSYHSTMKPTYLWYAYYNDALYNSMYSDAEDSLGEYFDTKYGNNDPNGYAGLIDWALSQRKSELSKKEVTVNDIESIQAYTDETMYGTGVVAVEVTYKEGTDLSTVEAEDYILEDRGSLNPNFGQIKIADISVKRNVVTLEIALESAATENNKLVYTGDNKEGSRERNAFGIYCTGAWYRDENGVIHYGKDDNDEYENNTTNMGYQARECLELKLRHVGEPEEAAACLADDKGQYDASGLWLPTEDTQFGEGGFLNLYDLQIPSTAAAATDGTGDAYVRGYYYVPEDYDPANGIVFTIQGQGISYWKLADGCDNAGTGIMYDSATTSWANWEKSIVVNIHDRSSAGKGAYTETYDYVADDVAVMKYFIDKYSVTGNIVIQGNSRGTAASNNVIRALAGCEYPKNGSGDLVKLDKSVYNFEIDTYICQNGSFGGSAYTDEVWAAVAATGLKVWAFDGEQDSNNIENIAKYRALMKEAGKTDEWLNQNIRLTGYTSNLYYPWGESDHSTTRINGWYFSHAAYYGPSLTINANGDIKYSKKLSDGEKYTLEGRGTAGTNSKAGYEYTVYDDLYQVWAFEAAEAK